MSQLKDDTEDKIEYLDYEVVEEKGLSEVVKMPLKGNTKEVDNELVMEQVLEMRINDAATKRECLEYIKGLKGVTERQALNIYNKAIAKRNEILADEIVKDFNSNMKKLENLRRKAIKEGDRRLELDVIKEQNKMNGFTTGVNLNLGIIKEQPLLED